MQSTPGPRVSSEHRDVPASSASSAAWPITLGLATAALAWSIAIACAGGIDLRPIGIPLVARTPRPTLIAAALLLAASLSWRRRRAAGDAAVLVHLAGRCALPAAVVLAAAVAALGIRLGTFAVGGSDSNCYVEQAERWAAGTMLAPIAPGFVADWPNASLSLTPTGFVPSRRVEGAIAPICPSGLSLLMAAPRIAGAPRVAVFYVVPAFGALAVLCAYVIGKRMGGRGPGVASALLAASSPVFLYQVVQPMSDIPATALWLLALACVPHGSPAFLVAAGLASGAAVLVRPNLAPLAGLVLLAAAAGAWVHRATEGHTHPTHGNARWSTRVRSSWLMRAALVAVGLLPAVVAVGAVQQVLYGSPLSSGYGNPGLLFRASHVAANLARYPRWLVETQSPLIVLGVVAPLVLLVAWRRVPAGAPDARSTALRRLWLACTLWTFALGAFAAYLPYVPFDGWWFLRFWLPGIPPSIVLMVATIAALARAFVASRTPVPPSASDTREVRSASVPSPVGPGTAAAVSIAGALACVALAAWQAGLARERSVFDLQRFERKFVVTGEYAGRLPETAVVLTIWHSGAVTYYGERPIVMWDAIAPDDLGVVVDSLRRQDREPFLLLEPAEEEAFRARFGGRSAYAALDWPARARFGTEAALWALDDRERFLRGDAVQSERVWVR